MITGAVSQTAKVLATQSAEEFVHAPGFSVVAAVACFHAVEGDARAASPVPLPELMIVKTRVGFRA